MDKDYYAILKVPPTATLKQIKRAYRSLALRYHPDRVPVKLKKDAEQMFKEISEAYQILSNSEKRQEFDLGREWNINLDPEYRKKHFTKDYSNDPDFAAEFDLSFWSNFEIDCKSKFWALVVAAVYLLMALIGGGLAGLFSMLINLVFPLACIFFAEELGSYTGFFRMHIMSPTPAPFVIFIGWVWLLMPIWLQGVKYLASL